MNSFHVSSLPTCKRLRREVESPPDVISSTFTYNHTEKQHGFSCDGLQQVQYMEYYSIPVYIRYVVMFTGLQHELSNNMYIRPLKQVNILPTATGTHMETHQTGAVRWFKLSDCSHIQYYWILRNRHQFHSML